MLRAIAIVLISTGGAAATQDRPGNVPVGGATVVSTAMVPADGAGLRVTVESAVGKRLRLFGGGSPGATLVEGAPTIGARFAVTTEAHDGVATWVGTRYSAVGQRAVPSSPSPPPRASTSARLSSRGRSNPARARRDRAGRARRGGGALSRRLEVGVAGHATIDLDGGRADGGELRWEASGGPTATLRLGRVALLVDGGAAALATPSA